MNSIGPKPAQVSPLQEKRARARPCRLCKDDPVFSNDQKQGRSTIQRSH
jgi:hypothetical protein